VPWKWKVCQDRNQCQDLFIVQSEHFVRLTWFCIGTWIWPGQSRRTRNYVNAGLSQSGFIYYHYQCAFSYWVHLVLIALSSICGLNQYAISSIRTKPVSVYWLIGG